MIAETRWTVHGDFRRLRARAFSRSALREQDAPKDEAAAEDGVEEVDDATAAVVEVTEIPLPERDEEEAAPVEEAVERTRKTWFGRIGGIFKRGLDDALWEEIRAGRLPQLSIHGGGLRERVNQ